MLDRQGESHIWLIFSQNVLEGLDKNFEDEKAALLAAFRNKNNSMEREKERQLALAKLKVSRFELEMCFLIIK